MSTACSQGIVAAVSLAILVTCWSLFVTLTLKLKIQECKQIRQQKEELVEAWQLILSAKKDLGGDR